MSEEEFKNKLGSKDSMLDYLYEKEEMHSVYSTKFSIQARKIKRLEKGLELYEHRLKVANEYIESRKEHMIPEHYEDLRYIINKCDLESSW